jgi:hypothetical protein
MNRAIPVTIVAIFFVSSVGCASFRAGKLPRDVVLPPASAKAKKSIALLVSGQYVDNGREMGPQFLMKDWRNAALDVYRGSDWFSEVKEGDEADLQAELTYRHSVEIRSWLVLLSWLTSFLVPAGWTEELSLRTVFKDSAGTVLGTFERSELLNIRTQTLLIFAYPFMDPGSIRKRTERDLSRATLADARRAGII